MLLLGLTSAPGVATYLLLTGPVRPQERQYLRDLGVTAFDLMLVRLAVWYQAIVPLVWMPPFVLGLVSFGVQGLGPALVPRDVPFEAAVLAIILTIPSSKPRVRLLASAARCTRLLCTLAPNKRLIDLDFVFSQWLNNPIYQRQRVAAAAWALTRDTARLTGQPVSTGATVGELLLWFGRNPSDKRRRPIVGAHLAELITATANWKAIPHADFAPAARQRTRPPRREVLRQLRATVTGTLATGVVLALVSALLRVWLK